MINKDSVLNIVKAIGGYDDAYVAKYDAVIDSIILTVQNYTPDDTLHNDSRIIYLAATKVNYELALIINSDDNVSSFKAGDISIVQNGDALNYAKLLLNNAQNDCVGLINDDGFAFIGV